MLLVFCEKTEKNMQNIHTIKNKVKYIGKNLQL